MRSYLIFPFICVILIAVFITYKIIYDEKHYVKLYPIEKLGLGKASKTEFSGHRYIIWHQNLSDCIVHDPDCDCQNKPKIIWDKSPDGLNIHDLDCDCCKEQK
jgi:hypothetical protein